MVVGTKVWDLEANGFVDPPTPTPGVPTVFPDLALQAELDAAVAALRATYLMVPQLFGARRVAYLGDSFTTGTGATNATYGFATQSTRVAGTAYAQVFVNGGNAGDKSSDALARLPAILAQAPDHVHIQVGTNDASNSVSLATFSANVTQMAALCKAAGVTVSIGTVPPRGPSDPSIATIDPFIRLYNLWIRLWASRQAIAIADTYAALADPTTGYLAAAYIGADNTHPNNAGHLAMARLVGPCIAARQLALAWPVNAVSPIGLIANPLMSGGGTGWADQGGTGTATTSTVDPSPGDGLPAGKWLSYTIDNTAGGGAVNRQIAYTLDNTKYSAGDTLVVFAYLWTTDTTTTVSAKLALTNGGTLWATVHDTVNSVGDPGPIMVSSAVPASPTTVRLGLTLSVPAGMLATAYLGAVQVFNLTTGGLVALA